MRIRHFGLFIFVFKILSYIVIVFELLFIVFEIYCKLKIGRLLNFGLNTRETIEYEAYFHIIQFFNNLFWEVICVLLIISIIYYFKIRQLDTNLKIGILGLLIAALYIFSDPFGLVRYALD